MTRVQRMINCGNNDDEVEEFDDIHNGEELDERFINDQSNTDCISGKY